MGCHTSKNKSLIFIVDDHELVRRGLCALINGTDDMRVCCQASSVKQALTKLATGPLPDLSVIDLSLPDGNGIKLIKRIHENYPDMRLLAYSMYDEELFAERALNAGAMGYLSKDETAARLLDAIRHILTNKVYLSQQMQEGLFHNSDENNQTDPELPIKRLSDRELEIFEFIGKGKKTSEIAEALHISVKTVETHRVNIKRKLNLESSTTLTQNAIQWLLEQRYQTK